ncbi:MAG: hypothetical protein CMH57_13575 [Myxococcales bacterium]|nr:hypothetical protein [Myxococcales bacterium]
MTPETPTPREAQGVHLHANALDIVGDVHGCMAELEDLMRALGWLKEGLLWRHPEGRRLVLVGDLVNRGPESWQVLAFAEAMRDAGRLTFVLGNHDSMLLRTLQGDSQQWYAALSNTIRQLERHQNPDERRASAIALLEGAPLWASVGDLEEPELVVVHACWHPRIAQIPERLREPMCVYGPVSQHERERPKRLDWRPRYPKGAPTCVHGHTAYHGPIKTVHNTICIDTGCVFGGELTALRWPEREFIQVPARHAWSRYPNIPSKPPLFDPSDLPGSPEIVWPWDQI